MSPQRTSCFYLWGQASWAMSEPRSRNTLRDTGLYCGLNLFTCRF